MRKSNDSSLFRFRDEAMATHFELFVSHEDEVFANSLSHICFKELERLENLLSRFRDGSDIARINQLKQGEMILISDEAYNCIRQGLEIQVATHGYFDMAVAGYMDLILDDKHDIKQNPEKWQEVKEKKSNGKLTIHHDRSAITCDQEGLQLDLGGIGKGYALQHIANLIDEMGTEHYMISAGGSTVLAKGLGVNDEPWSINFDGDNGNFECALKNESISSSGFSVKGAHLIKNEQQIELNAEQKKRIWVKTNHSALSDALSTACLLMNDEEVISLADLLNAKISVWKETETGITQIV